MTGKINAKRDIEISFSEEIELKDNVELKSFIGASKKFITHIISGWFLSKRSDLSPKGVNKERVIDRKSNFYKETVVDIKTNRVIRDIVEKLTDHK